jgi:hypothetical protein
VPEFQKQPSRQLLKMNVLQRLGLGFAEVNSQPGFDKDLLPFLQH